MNILEGEVLLVDKPIGWTSFDVVAKFRNVLRRYLGKQVKIGHAGTLDPLASGLLILCTGKKTRSIEQFMGLSKTYTGTLKLGETTPSLDRETAVSQHFPTEHITSPQVADIFQSFLGIQQQVPPDFSAIKKGGERSYVAAREGRSLSIDPRTIEIYAIEPTRLALPEIDFTVSCSKGTYIRSLARDIGSRLQSGAYLLDLRRSAIGTFEVSQAKTVSEWLDFFHQTLAAREDSAV
jgi:tRNA pseudouridine55 synthase